MNGLKSTPGGEDTIFPSKTSSLIAITISTSDENFHNPVVTYGNHPDQGTVFLIPQADVDRIREASFVDVSGVIQEIIAQYASVYQINE